ncbi:hypothetical protein [Microbispora bryophytorum]|uniref:Uncharacterized protein n=1 Tax=Microbispora bryophytorum TaxID=1460882 RepID=A0A8H9H5S2_9ACTN|nr:hypothetical protein [Microbispora bryophytorum]MBD3141164.1 hypothetical protein [Microbispora bryophytorum]TQR99882.1 hypothetical protein FLX07_34110 [Microbispora bryophytorum]GGO31559.1 hypothetical protein GCM10011574_69480 [Microbispora bryophytorum]
MAPPEMSPHSQQRLHPQGAGARIRRGTLLTGIVTILRNENGFVEVRAATAAEAARVLGVERLPG